MSTTKIFKVIKIIDEYNIVINAGSKDGIKEDDKLEIFIQGEQVEDPDTGEKLGTLDTIKAQLKVITVYEKFCVCTNNLIITTNNSLAQIAALSSSLSIRKEIKKLNVESTQISGGFKNDDIKIKIGDLVRKSLS